MKRARIVEIRSSMEAAQAMVKAGILFIPMPVLNAEDQMALANQMLERFEKLAQQAEVDAMSAIVKECPCGCEGPFMGMRHKEGYLSLTCPDCNRSVQAFTAEGLAENWNADALPAPEKVTS